MRHYGWAIGVVAAWLGSTLRAGAATTAAGFTETAVATKLGSLTSMAWAPDGSPRLFLTRQTGEILIVEEGKVLDQPFATVSPIVAGGELGLLGIAFDPNFGANGYLYVFATVSTSEQQILRYSADGNTGRDPTVIVKGLPTRGANHNGGALAFGADGKLYWAVGDNGTQLGAGNDLFLFNAKVGRANRDGTVPTDNPFNDGDGLNNDYIWARGFRNPFTMTFQPATGQLWLNVVGTNYEQVFRLSAGDHGGWADYESDQPAGYVAPVISYKTGAIETHTIPASGTVRLGGKVTVYTTDPHRYRPGARVTVAGVTDASFNGDFFVSEVLAPTQLSFLQAGPDAVSGNGSVSSQAIGNCLTGGTFWDSTAVPPEYRGNFFFGDYGSGRVMRAVLDASNDVTSVEEWGNDVAAVVDMDVGPDGDLYYATVRGNLYHASYAATEQALVVSRKNVRLDEGGTGAFDVRLAVAPPAVRAVQLSKRGDLDVMLTSPTTLTFTPENWMLPQPVTLSSAPDSDSTEDSASVHLQSSGLSENVDVRVTDANPSSFLLSMDELVLDEGGTVELEVSLTQRPDAALVVTASLVGDEQDVQISEGAELSFLPRTWNTPQIIKLEALQDDDAVDDRVTLRLVGRGPVLARDVPVVVHDDEEPIVAAGGADGGGGAAVAPVETAGAPGTAGAADSGGTPALPEGQAGQLATDMPNGGLGGHEPEGTSAGQAAVEGGLPGASGMGSSAGEGNCSCAVPGAATGGAAAAWGALLLGVVAARARRSAHARVRKP